MVSGKLLFSESNKNISMYLESEINCDICGAMHSKSGKAFDRASLAKHMATVHPPELHQHPASALICDICGVNQSSTGKRFTLPSQVWQHKKKRHPHALNMHTPPVQTRRVAPTPPELRVPFVATPQTEANDNYRNYDTPKNDALKFCPCCGFNLAVVHAAIDFEIGEAS